MHALRQNLQLTVVAICFTMMCSYSSEEVHANLYHGVSCRVRSYACPYGIDLIQEYKSAFSGAKVESLKCSLEHNGATGFFGLCVREYYVTILSLDLLLYSEKLDENHVLDVLKL